MTSTEDKLCVDCPIEVKWIIDENSLKTKKQLDSVRVKVAFIPGVEYYIRIFPNGQNNKPDTWIYVFLLCGNRKIKANISISIETASFSYGIENIFEQKLLNYHIGYGIRVCSYPDLLNPEKKFIIDGKLTVKIKGTLKAVDLKRKATNEISTLGDLLLAHKEKDFVIVAEEKEIPVHKWILEARSPVFKAMFESGMKEAKENRHEIPDFPFEVVKASIGFLYEQDIKSQINESNDCIFLFFGDKYNIQHFHDMIQAVLIEKINKENVCKYANTAVTSNAHELRENCTCFIALCLKNGEVIDDAEKFCDEILKDVSQRMLFTASRKVR